MNIIYSDEKLIVDLENNEEIFNLKNKLFSILNDYNIGEVELNTTGNVNDQEIGNIVREYHNNYNGVIKINYK